LFLIRREERELRIFKDKALRIIFGPKGEDVIEDWRKLHNEELHGLCPSPNVTGMIKFRNMRWAEHVKRIGAKKNAYRTWMAKPQETIPLGGPKHKW
jgi:hypothetical protein